MNNQIVAIELLTSAIMHFSMYKCGEIALSKYKQKEIEALSYIYYYLPGDSGRGMVRMFYNSIFNMENFVEG